MLLNKNSISIVLLTVSLGLFAQKKKADKLYEKAQYVKAISYYEKAAKTSNSVQKQESLIKLADCYRILNEYKKSEDCYRQALALGKVSPDVNYNYGNVLKNNNNYSEALNNYFVYLEAQPTDKKAEYAIKSCKEIKYWQSKPQEYQVKDVEAINTRRSEFSPVVLNNKLVFIAEKQNDFIEYTTSDLNGQPYLNVFYADLKGNEIGKAKQLSGKINSNYHDGPVAFTEDGKTMFLTRVNYIVNKRNKDFVNRAKLYISTGHDKSWGKPAPFQYNSDDYSCAHASLSADGNTLYFTSDMPGGFGGKDIWMCKKNGAGWDKPVNLGVDVNTSGDEMFPYIRKDGMLFFSSNGLPGFGGLDILSAKQKDGRWLLNRNEGLLLNSSADDFGIVFVNDSIGYFSSNRDGGKGKDDVYSFIYTSKYITVDGTVLLTENNNDPAKDVKVYLLDDKGKVLDSTKTNEKGYFAFKNLEADRSYMAEIENDDNAFKNKSRYFLADKNNKISRITHSQGPGQKFVFKNLPVDPNGLPDLYNDDDLSLAGNLLYGENPSKPLANKKVVIRNESGDVMETTTTNEFGAFAFRNLPLDQNYSLSVEDDDLPPDMKITLTNKSGKEVKFAKSDAKGKFKFSILSVDKSAIDDLSVDDKELIMALNGYLYDQDKKSIPNAKVILFNKNEVIENIVTDDKGKFSFKNLGAEKNYLFSIDDSDPRFAGVTKIFIADSKGRIYRELKRNKNGKFQFDLIELDRTAMGDYSVDDPWLQVLEMKNKQRQEAITIIESLYYAYGDYKIDAAGYNILDKVITVLNSNPNLNIELSSHTDSRSSDSFNMALSQKRAKAAVDYIISKGISKSRLKAIGYGETHLLNNCKNDMPCSEEEHAKNRRTEFKIVEVGKI
jgi:outer membrane protein OmpA-like peptidoglycan-associated protein/tetratricopeptide (TPR) repeat protein